MPSSTPNLSNPQHTIDETKQYNRVVFQQGKPVLDTDLNDLSGLLLAQTAGVISEKLGFGPPQLNYREWAIVNGSQTLSSARNTNNFGVSLGRLPTAKGVIDTTKLAADGLGNNIMFDHYSLANASAATSDDRPYANYVMKGKVTAASTTTSLVDQNKAFSASHGLTTRSNDLIFTPAAIINSPVSTDIGNILLNKAGVRFYEGACFVVFTTGALEGERRQIDSFTSTSLSWGAALTQAPAVGDEYVIVPANMLEAQVEEYNSASSQTVTKPDGFNRVPRVLTYVQVFEEDISSEEDTEIINGALGFETTHRSQLRWCVRTALVSFSREGDVSGSDTLSPLRLAHLYAALQDTATAPYQAALDSVGSLPQSAVAHYWREVNSAGSVANTLIGDSPSPFYADGITPIHIFGSVEASFNRLLWPFLKVCALMSLDGMNGFNDVQVLNLFHAESKSNRANAADETLSPQFYLGATTDTTQATLAHARLGVAGLFNRVTGDTGASGASYLAPPRLFMNSADMSTDISAARSFGPLASLSAPYVFPSLAAHMNALDSMLIGLLGLGSIGTAGGVAVPSSVDYQLSGTESSFAQAGYGAGAVRPLAPLSAASGAPAGFLSGATSYLLREKGSRSTHTVSVHDEDLGWGFYKNQAAAAGDFSSADGFTDLSARKWHEGIAQAKAFSDGLNFRKLAIKTTAHKSMDLFTVADAPFRSSSDLMSGRGAVPSAKSVMIPSFSEDLSGFGKDSYSGLGQTATAFIPGASANLALSPLIASYRSETHGVSTIYGISSDDEMRELAKDYGLWNRFDVTAERANVDESQAPLDLWHNRATAMRLRYHVGDFYPGEVDARGVPRNLLVDSLNLFVRIEPLSLTHWMTMPKHQHTILENSIVFAEGIEALLKVSHGLGDVQKLVSLVGGVEVPRAQAGSPAVTEGLYPGEDFNTNLTVGQADVTNMPFPHEAQPFVHWYHPAMHKIKMPDNASYDPNDPTTRVSPYPKWGRRSTIVPAITPMMFVPNQEVHNGDIHITAELGREIANQGVSTDAEFLISTSDNNSGLKYQIDNYDLGVLPYLYHASQRYEGDTSSSVILTDSGTGLLNYLDQISFPMRSSLAAPDVVGPVFLPASRKYAYKVTNPQMGFHPVINKDAPTQWDDISIKEGLQPYDERTSWWSAALGGVDNLPANLSHDFNVNSVPTLRAAIRTNTVAEIVRLVRTSFETSLQSATLSSDYDFTMPTTAVNSGGFSNQLPAVGPDVPTDTLFVGDMGMAIGGSTRRTSFLSPLNLGVGAMSKTSVGANSHVETGTYATFRDCFEMATNSLSQFSSSVMPPITGVFLALQKQGLQQKLLFNCSFRVLHHRPSGRDRSSTQKLSSQPKSITEVFLVSDRTNNGAPVPLTRGTESADAKPFLHLASMHPASNGITLTEVTRGVSVTVAKSPNYDKMKHLYPMVSDSLGAYRASVTQAPSFTNSQVQTGTFGDVFDIDPYDIAAGAPMLPSSNAYDNSGIEIELISELNRLHSAENNEFGLETQGANDPFTIISTMPTANEMTLPGDHEIVFVLYTGHYGARLHDTEGTIPDVAFSPIPSVAGCHVTATVEINRPSERVSSEEGSDHHYGVTVGGAPIKTYAIMSTVNPS